MHQDTVTPTSLLGQQIHELDTSCAHMQVKPDHDYKRNFDHKIFRPSWIPKGSGRRNFGTLQSKLLVHTDHKTHRFTVEGHFATHCSEGAYIPINKQVKNWRLLRSCSYMIILFFSGEQRLTPGGMRSCLPKDG